MDLEDIKEYAHKIQKIEITNNNQQSYYSYIVVKINLESSPQETIRFSLKEKDDFIEHQFLNDYYCRIPNKTNQTIVLYAHFFPKDLYIYQEEATDLISIYDFQNINNEDITYNNYTTTINENNNLIVQSVAEDSITNNYDPNYKQYTITNDDNETEQGFFPLSSKYRTNQNWTVPDINDNEPSWSNNNTSPFWEAFIKMPDIQMPINVFLNYEYLPTSREYHQHYYGLQSQPSLNFNNNINVFEGTNINKIDDKFGSDNNYRLINLNNPYDDSKSFLNLHKQEIDINLVNAIPSKNNNQETCIWLKNKCNNQYMYTALNFENNFCSHSISLKNNKTYSLQYYIYIPSNIETNTDTCYISIVTEDNTEYKIHDDFIAKDKEQRDEWIYHEIPFVATDNVLIKIVGPNYNINSDNNIYFADIVLKEETEYSPTLQYTDYGLTLLENNKKTFKPIILQNEMINIVPDDILWERTNTELMSPYSNVHITIDDEINNIENDVVIGIAGVNNTFVFNCTDDYNIKVEGTYRAGIFLDDNNNFDITDADKIITYYPTKINNSQIIFTDIDLTNLSTQEQYFIKIEYENTCYDTKQIFIQELSLLKEEIEIKTIKINDKIKTENEITIDSPNEFPLKIEAQITDQNNNAKTNGFCELSINDKVHQSTLVDNNGWVDFYLNLSDIDEENCYVIKIEYYRQYYQSLQTVSFNICIDELLYEKDIIFVDINLLKNDEMTKLQNNEYVINGDECILIDIDTKEHNQFQLEVYRDNILIIKENIYNKKEKSFWFINAEYGDYDTHTYLIRTGNMYDDNNNIIEDLYQTYERTFIIRNTKERKTSNITLTSPGNSVHIGETVYINGSSNMRIANIPIKIYNNNTLLTTVYTNSNGNFYFLLNTSSITTYSLTASFDGNFDYKPSNSNNVSISVTSKTIPTISLEVDYDNVIIGNDYTLTGYLLDNNIGIANKNLILENLTTSETNILTTDNNGMVSTTINALMLGTFRYSLFFAGDSGYESVESSYIDINITSAPSYIDIQTSQTTLSAYNNDNTTIYATVFDDNDIPISDVKVDFYIDGINQQSTTTDNNGIASYLYEANGDGDIEIIIDVEDGFLSDSYWLEDCIYYNTSEINGSSDYITLCDLSNTTIPNSVLLSFDYKTNYEGRIGLFSKQNFVSPNNPNYSVFVGTPNGSKWYYGYRTTSTSTTDINDSPTSYHNYTIERSNSTFQYCRDNGTIYSKTIPNSWNFDNYSYVIGMMQWGTAKTCSVKNVKLKKVN